MSDRLLKGFFVASLLMAAVGLAITFGVVATSFYQSVGAAGEECQQDSDCAANEHCEFQGFLSLCKEKLPQGALCDENKDCLTNVCGPSQPGGNNVCLGTLNQGETCDPNSQTQVCKDGLVCEIQQIGGSQVAQCTAQECSLSTPCPLAGYYCDGGTCKVKLGIGQVCEGSNECQTNICVQDGAANRCGCTSTDQCLPTQYCSSSSLCVSTKSLGEPCDLNEQCNATAGEYCNFLVQPAVCSKQKSSDGQNQCAQAADCTSGVCTTTTGGTAFCGCNSDADCAGSNLSCVNQLCVSLKAAGQACAASSECQSNACVNDVCAATSVAGGKCGTHSDCDTNLYCDPANKTCAQKKSSGSCQKSYECLSNSCSSGSCQVSGEGDACTQNSDCGAGFYCLIGQNQSQPNAGVCSGKQQAGSGCSSNQQCLSNSCVQTVDGGNVCNKSALGGQCESFVDCPDTAYCGSNKTCVAKKAGGEQCASDNECAVGTCKKNSPTSATGICEGQACVPGLQNNCPQGQFCSDVTEKCQPKQAPGASCTDNSQCASGQCTGAQGAQTCSGLLQGGEACETNAQCLSGICQNQQCTAPAPSTPTAGDSLSSGSAALSAINSKFALFQGKGLIEADSPAALVGVIIKTILGVIGSVALAMFVYGGFSWMTAGGSPDRLKKARDTFVWSALGLLTVFASYAIVSYIINIFATQG